MSEMERKARNRAVRLEPSGAKAQPVSEMERRARNRAARHEPSGAKAQPVSEMERERGIELQGVKYQQTT